MFKLADYFQIDREGYWGIVPQIIVVLLMPYGIISWVRCLAVGEMAAMAAMRFLIARTHA